MRRPETEIVGHEVGKGRLSKAVRSKNWAEALALVSPSALREIDESKCSPFHLALQYRAPSTRPPLPLPPVHRAPRDERASRHVTRFQRQLCAVPPRGYQHAGSALRGGVVSCGPLSAAALLRAPHLSADNPARGT